MTDEQMRKRIKEIDKKRKELKDEREIYTEYFDNKKKAKIQEERASFVGRCFTSKGSQLNNNKKVIAFKILIPPDESTPNATCIVLTENNNSGKQELGIQIRELGLWKPNQMRLMTTGADPKMIDFYEEISQEEFNVLYRMHKFKIEEKVFG